MINSEIEDYRNIELKQDHQNYPIVLAENDQKIFLESFHPKYIEAKRFLIKIAECESRPAFIHCYKINLFSMYTAMVLQQKNILGILRSLSKNKVIPQSLQNFIIKYSSKYGCAKFSLIKKFYRLKIDGSEIKEIMRKHSFLSEHLVEITDPVEKQEISSRMEEKLDHDSDDNIDDEEYKLEEKMEIEQVRNQDLLPSSGQNFKYFTIITDNYFNVTTTLIDEKIPLIQEYDFEKDKDINKLEISTYPKTNPRPYQEKALENVFINGKARSGIIVLPCGAGKTLVGIMIMNQIKRSTIILCDRDVSVNQWEQEILNWCNISPDLIIKNSGTYKDFKYKRSKIKQLNDDTPAFILITTYKMLSQTLKDTKDISEDKNKIANQINDPNKDREITKTQMREFIKKREWGLLLADEVQTLPAKTYQTVLQYKFRVKIGLTATPYRGDNLIFTLYQNVGPKLYEENLLDLIDGGYLARPYCVEVRCQMDQKIRDRYQYAKQPQQIKLNAANPSKIRALQYLIDVHEKRGDTIIVFCDKIFVLKELAKKINRPYIDGNIATRERLFIFDKFKKGQIIQTVFLSSVGDTGIDIPAANVAIQIGGQYKSQRQEVQRLGRIMRPKYDQKGEYNAYFYNLVSQETDEVVYCHERQKCLINQGLSFEIIDEENLYVKQDQKPKLDQNWVDKLIDDICANDREEDDDE